MTAAKLYKSISDSIAPFTIYIILCYCMNYMYLNILNLLYLHFPHEARARSIRSAQHHVSNNLTAMEKNTHMFNVLCMYIVKASLMYPTHHQDVIDIASYSGSSQLFNVA